MASEIQISLPTISYSKGTIAINLAPLIQPLVMDVAGENSMHDVVTLSTSNLSLSKGNISTLGWVYLKNLDSTNNILIGSDGTNYPMMLKPGEYATFRWNASLVQVKSAAGAPIIEYCFIEN